MQSDTKNLPHITGLTGGIGSGKSSVARFLCNRFVVFCLDADKVVHQLLEPGRSCWQVIRDLDTSFIKPDSAIDKVGLREMLFSDKQLRDEINRRMHPLVRDEIRRIIDEESRLHAVDRFLVEVPLLFEAKWQDMFSEIITVFAGERKCLERVMARDGVTLESAENSISSQMPLMEKALLSQYVIENSGTWFETSLQLVHLGNLLWKGKKDTKKS
ncbi:MAG: dephospho-CoA kinase [Desulfobulbaceae bacterium]|nr:dephospho-CoA kinase [Desulfobulbaceae bacterium]